MQYDLRIQKLVRKAIHGNAKAYGQLIEYYKETFSGEWNFHVEVTQNTQDTQVIELNDVNELGIGFEKIVKDRFEITMYDIYTGDNFSADYFPVMLDADGTLMPYVGDGSANTVAIQDRDVSKVDIFLIDYLTWMDGGNKGT